jgi:hypothetical protein
MSARPGQPGKTGAAADEDTQLLDTIAKWTLREAALRDVLSRRVATVEASRREELELRESLRLLTRAFEDCRAERYDIVSDFTRQYKATLDELIRVVSTTERTVTELKDQQELERIALVQAGKERDHVLGIKDREIEEQNKRIAEMDEEFHLMLDEMRRRMQRRVADAVKAAKRAGEDGGFGAGDDDPLGGDDDGDGGGAQ